LNFNVQRQIKRLQEVGRWASPSAAERSTRSAAPGCSQTCRISIWESADVLPYERV